MIDGLIDELKEYTGYSYNDRELKRFLNASFGDIDLIKDVYDDIMVRVEDENKKPIKNMVAYIIKSIKQRI